MDYLNSIEERRERLSKKFTFYDLLEEPTLIFGNLPSHKPHVNFSKMPIEAQKEIKRRYGKVEHTMKRFMKSTCGNVIRIQTDAKKLVLLVELNRKRGIKKTLNSNSLGFDIYSIDDNGIYVHQRCFSPSDSNNMFQEFIQVPKTQKMCIYLPNFSTIKKCYIGIRKGKQIESLGFSDKENVPIVFYGNSLTQGLSASRSGNSYPNIVSRKVNREIINLSTFSSCKGLKSMAECIGKIKCSAIVIDYTRDAKNSKVLEKNHERFYKIVRKYHPDIPIILLSSTMFDRRIGNNFDKIVKETYENAIENNENTTFIYQKELFDEEERSYVTIDSIHYNDLGMYRLAEKISEVLKE